MLLLIKALASLPLADKNHAAKEWDEYRALDIFRDHLSRFRAIIIGWPKDLRIKVTIDLFRFIPMRIFLDVLKAISYSYNINIIITKNLTGKITEKLQNFTLYDALNAILGIHNYVCTRSMAAVCLCQGLRKISISSQSHCL